MAETFTRDAQSHALLNTDVLGVAAYKSRRAKSRQLMELDDAINTLRQDVRENRRLILQVLRDVGDIRQLVLDLQPK